METGKIAPCWHCSPPSVSPLFPTKHPQGGILDQTSSNMISPPTSTAVLRFSASNPFSLGGSVKTRNFHIQPDTLRGDRPILFEVRLQEKHILNDYNSQENHPMIIPKTPTTEDTGGTLNILNSAVPLECRSRRSLGRPERPPRHLRAACCVLLGGGLGWLVVKEPPARRKHRGRCGSGNEKLSNYG